MKRAEQKIQSDPTPLYLKLSSVLLWYMSLQEFSIQSKQGGAPDFFFKRTHISARECWCCNIKRSTWARESVIHIDLSMCDVLNDTWQLCNSIMALTVVVTAWKRVILSTEQKSFKFYCENSKVILIYFENLLGEKIFCWRGKKQNHTLNTSVVENFSNIDQELKLMRIFLIITDFIRELLLWYLLRV